MVSIWVVLLFSLLGGVLSLIGGFILLADKKRARLLAKYATPFAAGALLAAAFTDLLSEAGERGDYEVGLRFALFGILIFFVLEKFLHWFHHHHEHEDDNSDVGASLVIIGDTFHNFIDGVAIAAGFLVDVNTGMIVTLAVAAHEIPQEIGDFGLLLQKGLSRKKVLLVNVASAMATAVAAVLFFAIGQQIDIPLDAVLGLVAGFFIYIASSDIIPTIHEEKSKQIGTLQAVLLLLGALTVGLTTSYLHQYIEVEDSHDNEAQYIEVHSD